ncbi:MAG: hypothetical protein A2X85_11820 [Geobacteraceae bacterium GWF2_54_21]|nr:MAG: hypothetical protein A2X85_11820 [Geobacteraceae bacterium GWF2_54_21]
MIKMRKKYSWIDIGDDTRRQYIDAQSAFSAWEAAYKDMLNVRGSMRWKNQNGADYLIRVSTSGSNKSLGPRSEENEKIHDSFVAQKTAAKQRFSDLTETLERQQRMNRALFVGRAPRVLVDILNRLYKEGISEFFIVIGTHALYAYEARAGVLFGETEAMATQDVDFLLDERKRICFVTKMKHANTSMLKLIQKVDPSFRLREDQKYTAVNSKGFEVDIIRREPEDGDPHPMRLTDDEDDEFYVVPARNAGILLDGPPFSAIIVSASGHMARMNTISPLTFIQFKKWMAGQAERDTMKRSRDLLQANLVEELVNEYLPQLLTQKS